ncbi:MAG: DUF995 domain-containing protein [Sulfurimicrobium sp.]|nr:DUF995 domain-containing protein [Sulfurimicrobium sp.]MDP1703069.1 DUF995 domain-containing protein [Sulfurimicrobium sp.]MDP1897081.1 DUF995 domain-containing protein [Sulfurimicrobium sp.]MDP2197021.1 DUF995 domain-containing protein [Sulfurimicrobium sp.]MDP3689352.1 DUF995 domain-containing protein [Sulfurimicrobium sp.]
MLLNDIKAQNGVQLSADELKQLMPNAKVVSYSKEESTRRWTNEPDGKFVASTDIGRDVGLMLKGAATKTGQGTWHVGDNGTYCVTLDWKQRFRKLVPLHIQGGRQILRCQDRQR